MTRLVDGVARVRVVQTSVAAPELAHAIPRPQHANKPKPVRSQRGIHGKLDGVRPRQLPQRMPQLADARQTRELPRPALAAALTRTAKNALKLGESVGRVTNQSGRPTNQQPHGGEQAASASSHRFDGIAQPVTPVEVAAAPARWPRLATLTGSSWRKPLAGAAMAMVALVVSSVVVRAMATPEAVSVRAGQTVATAAPSAQPTITPAPSPAPTASIPPKVLAATATIPTSITIANLGLASFLDQYSTATGGRFSIYVKDLTTGEIASTLADRSMTSASLYKLFVAQRILHLVDLGETKLSAAAGGGTGKTIDSCLNVMITISDNGCGAALGTKLGWGKQNQALGIEGYNGTDLAAPQKTSAADVGHLLERLYSGTLLSAASSDTLVALLKNQRVNNRLPQGLPAGTVFAHKTGDLNGYSHDAGIVYGPKTNYVVVAMGTPGTTPAQFARLSSELWAHFEQ